MDQNYMNKMFSLEGKVALITGATHGIGMAIGCALAHAGAIICFNGRYESKNKEAELAYKKEGVLAKGYVCDVRDEKQVKDLVAPFIVSKAVLPGMINRGHGKIINICSMMSEVGRESVSAYAAAKGGLKMLTKNICSEFGSKNIQCNGIGPGYIATSQTEPLRKRNPDGSRQPFDAFIISRTPAGRWGTPEDLQGPAIFLASDASNFVNGQILYVDGGILAYLGKQPK